MPRSLCSQGEIVQTNPDRRILLRSYAACYQDPIAVCAGDPVTLSGLKDIWEGHVWVWARSRAGKEGWVPDDLVCDAGNGVGAAARDYSAMELTCCAGDVVTVVMEDHGWAWCENAEGRAGWVPQNCFVAVPPS